VNPAGFAGARVANEIISAAMNGRIRGETYLKRLLDFESSWPMETRSSFARMPAARPTKQSPVGGCFGRFAASQ
jgi:hypothetical protein